MRRFLALLSLTLLSLPAFAADPKTVPKGGTIAVPVTLSADALYVTSWTGKVTPTAEVKTSLRDIVVHVAGDAVGTETVIIGTATGLETFDVTVVEPAPMPVVVPVPTGTVKKLDAPPPVPVPPVKSATPKKVGSANPTQRPLPDSRATASASTIRAINVRPAVVPSSSGTATSGVSPASVPATIRTVAPPTGQFFGTTKADVNCSTSAG